MFGGNYEDGLQARPSPAAKWQLKETIHNIHNKFQNSKTSQIHEIPVKKKKKNFQKTPATQQKKQMVTCHCAPGFFCSSSPARCDSQFPGTSAWRDNLQEGGRHWWWGIRRCCQTLIFWNPKNEKGECCWLADPKHVFTRENKKKRCWWISIPRVKT